MLFDFVIRSTTRNSNHVATASQLNNDRSRSSPRSAGDVAKKVFSFPVMCMVLLSAVLLRYCIRGIAESDIWWVLRNAQQLLSTHFFPRVDSYSFTAAGSLWPDKEWLSGLVYFLGYKTARLQGILLVYFSVLILIFVESIAVAVTQVPIVRMLSLRPWPPFVSEGCP